MSDFILIEVSRVVFRNDLYPRMESSVATVQKYAEDLEVLPPIEINQHNELIDGWHRWTAHKKMSQLEIKAIVTPTNGDAHLLELAIDRNAAHGLQLSQADKQSMARKIYNSTHERDRAEKKKQLAKLLSVSSSTVQNWLSRIDKDAKEERNNRIFDKWLACWTQEEVAKSEGLTQQATALVLQEFPTLEKLVRPQQTLATYGEPDWKPPIYNVWKQQEKTEGSKHFGNSESRWVDNLIYLYTNPFDVVVDPFAGGGSTIDVCKKRSRRYFVSDRKPIVEREKDIRKHDLTDGILKPPQWHDVKLVYLDPPYWIQAQGQYSQDETDLANMDLDKFSATLSGIVAAFSKKLSDAYIALIIQPTQWKAQDRKFVDHVGDLLRSIKLPVEMRFSVPYESQQCNAQMVEWAKENKKCLVLTREIIVWRVEK